MRIFGRGTERETLGMLTQEKGGGKQYAPEQWSEKQEPPARAVMRRRFLFLELYPNIGHGAPRLRSLASRF
jgi:hypothetical protein